MKKRLKYIGLALILAMIIGAVVAQASVVMSDDFQSYSSNATITNDTTYNFANFPGAGSSGLSNPSTKWEMDTGSFIAKTNSGGQKWGYLPTTDLFRLNTQATAKDAVITWTYKSTTAQTAVDVWLRYQTQYWLYALQFDRSDNCLVAKRKLPTNTSASGEWGGVATGHGAEIANKGVYYVLRIDADTPAHVGGACNQDGVTWTQVGGTNLAHDGTLDGGTSYDFKATITTIPAANAKCNKSFDCTQLQIFRGGVLYASWTDKNDGLNFNATRTLQQDCDAGWYTTVTGYTSDWCKPIYTTGKSGFRNDENTQEVWIDNFTMTDNAGAATSGTVTASSTIAINYGAVRINNGTLRLK